MNLSRTDLLNLALAVSAAATSAYIDERLSTAATQHHLAARLWAEVGYACKAGHHGMLADAITNEMIELASTPEEELV
jgi:hypothetical protein